MRDFRNYWNDGCKVMSMREGYHSELPTIEMECKTEQEAEEMANDLQMMEGEEYNKLNGDDLK